MQKKESRRLDKALAELAQTQREAREEAKRLDKALAELAEAQAELMVAQ